MERTILEDKKFCLCGTCNQEVHGYYWDSINHCWIQRRFIHGHHNKVPTKTTRKLRSLNAISRYKLSEKHPRWKGDSVDNDALHHWVRTRLSKPELCELCDIKIPYDLANITGIYNREFKNWAWYCRRCHMLSDGRMNNLEQYRKRRRG